MNIFRKKKEKPKKRPTTRVAEFEFKPGGVYKLGYDNEYIPVPGDLMGWGRRAGWDVERLKQLLKEERDMPREGDDWDFDRFGHIIPQSEQAANFIARKLSSKHRTHVGIVTDMGDFIVFRTSKTAYKMSNTALSSQVPIDVLIDEVEKGLFGAVKPMQTEWAEKTNTPTNEWAEQWAKKQK